MADVEDGWLLVCGFDNLKCTTVDVAKFQRSVLRCWTDGDAIDGRVGVYGK